jgi:hypothetical protein
MVIVVDERVVQAMRRRMSEPCRQLMWPQALLRRHVEVAQNWSEVGCDGARPRHSPLAVVKREPA